MSTHAEHPDASRGRHRAEVARLERLVRFYGTLTEQRLREFSDADTWHDGSFDGALHDAVACGAIRRLGDNIYVPAEGAAPLEHIDRDSAAD